LRVADDAAGKQARCPACGNVSRVPAAVGAGTGPAPWGESNYGGYASPQTPPLANPFSDPAPVKPSPYGPQGVNPFGDAAAGKTAFNPYQAPSSHGYAHPGQFQDRIATRDKRLVGAILDGLIHLLGLIPGAIVAGIMGAAGASEDAVVPTFVVVGFGGVFLVAIANWVLISRTGQSFGKRMVGTQIIRIDTGQPAGFVNGVLLRILVPQLINQTCSLFGLIDVLWIFGEERRCLHDLIAQTVVIEV
jgi:uncharacterized RDD family membrane protein YckC